MITRSNVNDTVVPSLVDSANARDFITECLKMTPSELLLKLELFACSQTIGQYAVKYLELNSSRRQQTPSVRRKLPPKSTRLKLVV
jgi:hypothetical protein